ncbi:aldo/keto reductase [Amycolatopsis sp. OK19-0408]|uniref:Aldo/keto reductase n=1 Tax=Amycolatopsis iheyensis TaxID=2945988 RepID=A0A9X2SIQ6_9PSEU|nr:aldo/keto reductase [Amycolatopsis iheyensis]MCR6481495.1 aldo/keto reductase [Amycolatopsis iheyensis]
MIPVAMALAGPAERRRRGNLRRLFAIAGAGREAGAVGGEHAEVLAIAKAHEASAAQVRSAWLLHRGPHVLVIPGTGDPGHLADNVAAGRLRLTEDDLARLDKVHREEPG